MAKKRSAQLDQEIREALAKIPKNSKIKTPAQLDAEIDAIIAGGLPAERYEVANAMGFRYPKRPPPKGIVPTGTNIFALADLVLEAGGKTTFSNRMDKTHIPHIKRTLAAGLVEVSSPTTLTLTPEGRATVLRELRESYKRDTAGFERDPTRYDARSMRRIEQLRTALETLEST